MAANHHHHMTNSMPNSSHNLHSNVVGVHYRVGKKIGEGSFGVIFEGKGSKMLKEKYYLQTIIYK